MRKVGRRVRRRWPPWWFMPVVMAGAGATGVLLSLVMTAA